MEEKLVFQDRSWVSVCWLEDALQIELRQSKKSPPGNDAMKPLAKHSTFILYNSLGSLGLLKPLYSTAK